MPAFHPDASTNHKRRRPQYLIAQAYGISPGRSPPSLNAYTTTVARAALKWIAGASITTSALLMLQLVWIVLKTPRLPPPPFSGVHFVREGRVVRAIYDDDHCECSNKSDGVSDDSDTNTYETTRTIPNQATHNRRKEFRLVIVGDSPVEGIGNTHHKHALGGQTASAFARVVYKEDDKYDCVRYWSYGKSGLTAAGIEKEMIPLLHRVVDDVHHSTTKKNDGTATNSEAASDEPAIHAIILLCGVNNVLDPASTTSSFHSEVQSLLKSIRCYPGLECTPLIVLGLPDFSKLPFLPWPLKFALGLRGRKMQQMLEFAVGELQLKDNSNLDESQRGEANTTMVRIPEIQDVLGTIGYHRHDSNVGSTDEKKNETQIDNDSEQLKMRLCHPILKYIGDNSPLDQTKLGSLGIEDFLCDDGFHPGRYGTVYIGNLIAERYERLIGKIHKD